MFADSFVIVDVCDPDVKDIVNEGNVHHQTKMCRKKGTGRLIIIYVYH